MPSASLAVALSPIDAGAVNVPPSTGCVNATTGGRLGAQLLIARSTFSRPPVARIPVNAARVSTVLNIVFLSCEVLREHWERTSAAAPATCGVAIEVPLRDAYPPWYVDTIPTPGAARATDVGP